MFNKALFKQSCKANGIMWAIITFATCFMLACVMIISGNGNLTKLTGSMSSSIIESTVETTMEDVGLNYYVVSDQVITQFSGFVNEGNFDTMYGIFEGLLPGQLQQQAGLDEEQAQQLANFVIAVLNYDNNTDNIPAEEQSENLRDVVLSQDEDRMSEYVQKNVSILVAKQMISPEYIDTILTELESYGITQEDYETQFVYENESGEMVSKFTGKDGYAYIKDLSNTAIVTLRARVDYELSKNDGRTETEITQEIIGDLTQTFLDTLPDEISQSLREIGELDIYSMIVGTIFYNIAGLLLPMIYMIMCANNLIAGQVDRGSMAYVLSTSVKRKQVVFTQAMFLIGSLFAMFACMTVVSVVCLAILGPATVTLGYGELLLLNLGAFVAMFAMSGISFLASCWFNRTKYSLGLGGGINIFFLVATILGLFGSSAMPTVVRLDSLNFFNYVSIISLFDVVSILDGTLTFIWKLAILLGIGIVCYIIGAFKFQKKDLPL